MGTSKTKKFTSFFHCFYSISLIIHNKLLILRPETPNAPQIKNRNR